jgi:hypothetical protein
MAAWMPAMPQADKQWQTHKSNSHAIADTHCKGNALVKFEHPMVAVQPTSTMKLWWSEEDNTTALEIPYRAWTVNGDQSGISVILGNFKMEVRYLDPEKGTIETVFDGDSVSFVNGRTEGTGSVFINLPFVDDRHLIFTREGDVKVLNSPHVRVVELNCTD